MKWPLNTTISDRRQIFLIKSFFFFLGGAGGVGLNFYYIRFAHIKLRSPYAFMAIGDKMKINARFIS